jgi:hypothetical protein
MSFQELLLALKPMINLMKRHFSHCCVVVLSLTFILSASAEEFNRGGGAARGGSHFVEPRAKGVPQHGTFHNTVRPGAKPLRTPVLMDHRSHGEIIRDPHIVRFNHVGWHPVGHWDHWYRDWGVFWRINNWQEVQTVTCESVNTQTEMLFPVTESRGDGWYWSGDLVNNVAARALDECVAESGSPDTCSLVERECWNSTLY